jgi:hypothetical protein
MPFGNFDEICYFALFRMYVSGGGRLSGRRALRVRTYNAARVEEIATAAKSLEERALTLREAVAVFRLEEAHSAGEKDRFAPVAASGWNAAELL